MHIIYRYMYVCKYYNKVPLFYYCAFPFIRRNVFFFFFAYFSFCLLLSHLSGQHCALVWSLATLLCAHTLSLGIAIALALSPSPFAQHLGWWERLLACRTHGRLCLCVRESDGWLGWVKGNALLQKLRLFGDCSNKNNGKTHKYVCVCVCDPPDRVRKKINLNYQQKKNKTKQSWKSQEKYLYDFLYEGAIIEIYFNWNTLHTFMWVWQLTPPPLAEGLWLTADRKSEWFRL